jgi:hypothetical protein
MMQRYAVEKDEDENQGSEMQMRPERVVKIVQKCRIRNHLDS